MSTEHVDHMGLVARTYPEYRIQRWIMDNMSNHLLELYREHAEHDHPHRSRFYQVDIELNMDRGYEGMVRVTWNCSTCWFVFRQALHIRHELSLIERELDILSLLGLPTPRHVTSSDMTDIYHFPFPPFQETAITEVLSEYTSRENSPPEPRAPPGSPASDTTDPAPNGHHARHPLQDIGRRFHELRANNRGRLI